MEPRAEPSHEAKVIASLFSAVCPHCGEKKRHKESLCNRDYRRLPEAMRRALYQGIGQGYVEAFDAALAWLKENAKKKGGGK
jgi:hypothetical protein